MDDRYIHNFLSQWVRFDRERYDVSATHALADECTEYFCAFIVLLAHLTELVVATKEGIDEDGVEMLAGLGSDDVDGLFVGSGSLVASVAGDRVVGVHQRDDPGGQWNVIPLQPLRVPLAVVALVMAVGDVNAHFEEWIRGGRVHGA